MNRLHVLEGVGDKRPLEVYDIDDVLLKSRDGFVKISHQEWGHDPDIVKYKEEWDRWWGISHAETKKRSDYIWEQGLPLQFEPLEDAPEGLAMIARRARIVLLTSRPIIAKEVTIASIERHFDTSC
ncbi:MAG TPA: hypothetical protein VFH39_00105, partial [Candidatus Saccharimonadales bacterium]|nr:hypothetical protein [Candidatus Saccharimonadales bacterium]